MANGGQINPSGSQQERSKLQSSKPSQPIVVRFFTTRNLSVLIAGLVLIIAMFRADQKDIPVIVQTLVDSRSTAVIGWALAFIILIVAVVFVRLLSHIYEKEIERICKERDKLQNRLMGDKEAGGEKL